MVGKTEHHVQNSIKDFVRDVREIRIEPDEQPRSYDMSAVFNSVPVDKALEVIRERLEVDQTLRERTPLVIWLLSLCLKCTYFLFRIPRRVLPTDTWGGHGSLVFTDNLYMETLNSEL